MQYRQFGKTELNVSEVGFGAWAIGGPAMAGDMPIGWGDVDDPTSVAALKRAFDLGVNFFDTADLYGLGHSEELIGDLFGNRHDVVIASKLGQRIDQEGKVYLDYSKEYVLQACEQSLRRLKREAIDFYQLHAARMPHLEQGECIEAMEQLQKEGKIRYWGLSINTFAPEPEARYLMERNLGHGFQLVLNIINQRAVPVAQDAGRQGYGLIARMPLQFGLLTGKFTRDTRFEADDHRSFRLPPPVLEAALDALEPAWKLAEKHRIAPIDLALSFILSFPEISTVIPGIKTPQQIEKNTAGLVQLPEEDRQFLQNLYQERFLGVMEMMQKAG